MLGKVFFVVLSCSLLLNPLATGNAANLLI
jgi:hypothetical protein